MESRNESTKVPTAEPFSAMRRQIFSRQLSPLYTMAYVIKDFLELVDNRLSGCSPVVRILRVKIGPFWCSMSLLYSLCLR
jgi:hypothetical protein